jgi:uncharacterized protein YuzE
MAMPKLKFRLEVSYNETTGEPVAAYLRVREGNVVETKELRDGVVFADYGVDGVLLGIEILAPFELTVLDHVADQEPGPVQHFLRDSVRRPLAFA